MARVVAPRARDHRDFPPRFFDRDLHNAGMLIGVQHRAFPGRPARNQKVDSFLDLPPNQAAQGLRIERTACQERRNQSRAATAKLIQSHRQHLLWEFQNTSFFNKRTDEKAGFRPQRLATNFRGVWMTPRQHFGKRPNCLREGQAAEV
jgi:hypothetical protein